VNVEKIIEELKQKYPGKKIIKNNEENTTEIICEIEPGLAIAVIDRAEPHYHKKTTELYEVIKGEMVVGKDGREYKLKEGEKLEIFPNEVHYVTGNETWIKAYSEPAWTQEDHILK